MCIRDRPQLASIASVHPNYLCRLFKARYGVSPMRYVYEKRMDYSRYLLLYTQISVSDIAAMVGYNDISHFSKEFKKYSIVSPRYFRNRTHTDLSLIHISGDDAGKAPANAVQWKRHARGSLWHP